MQNSRFPYTLFISLLLTGAFATFFLANTLSLKEYIHQNDMVTPFPIALELKNLDLQVVTAEELSKLQLPDPETKTQMVPHYLLNNQHFTDGNMSPKAIIGESITNGSGIHIPTNYSAQVSGKQQNNSTQEITIIYWDGKDEDLIITATYNAHDNHYIPQTQSIKNLLIWKTIFMNGMALSVILAFVICKRLGKKRTPTTDKTP